MAYSFDGTGDYLTFGSGALSSFAGSTPGNIAFKSAGSTSNAYGLFIFGDSGETADLVKLSINTSTGYLSMTVKDGAGNTLSGTGSTNVHDGAWHNVHFFIKSSGTNLELWLDGSSEFTDTNASFSTTTNGLAYVDIHRLGSDNTNDFNGDIDNYALENGFVVNTSHVNDHIVQHPRKYDAVYGASRIGLATDLLHSVDDTMYVFNNGTDTITKVGTPTNTLGSDNVYTMSDPYIGIQNTTPTSVLRPSLLSVTGIYDVTFNIEQLISGSFVSSTGLYVAMLQQQGVLTAPLLTSSGIFNTDTWLIDQFLTAPVITASGQVVATVAWDQQLAGALLQATGTLDTGVWLIDQNIAGQVLSATGILDTQTWLIDTNIAGVYITPTGLIAATFTGEQLYTGDFTFETPGSDSFTEE
jgi:hypothetical protein